MESNLLLEQYSWYKKQQLAKAPFECLLNADIEPNPHQVNAFCAAIQALKTGGIILADEVGLGKTIEAGLVLNYVLDNGAKKVLISLPATLRKQWEVELLEKFGRQAVILDRYTVEHDLANVQTHLGNADEVSIVIASYDYSSKLIKRFPHVKWDFLIIDEAHNLRNVFHGTKRAKNLYDLTHGIPKILLTATPLQNSLIQAELKIVRHILEMAIKTRVLNISWVCLRHKPVKMIRMSRKSMEMLLSKGMQIILRAKTMIMSRSLQIDLKHRLPLASAFT